ncbi:hypothetical protein BGZ70_003778 [Mortierella alpina]|uniref:Uncharacterized protein n=1 Tax=Mortierella alpina TaxID=64518 RepID=A0A9P6IRT7_MORAP|nr:hypothetical protein BGZ70_003778 [Mortierella alpina]
MLKLCSPRQAMLSALGLLLLAALPTSAAPETTLQTCYSNGCSAVFSMLEPCGGGVSNSTFHLLEQDRVYTPTASLGGCQCNSKFFNAYSSCLACISSVGETEPEIDNQQNWVASCASYGFNFTESPTANSTNPSSNNDANQGGGLSKGAIAGIVIGALAVLALIGACFFVRSRRRRQNRDLNTVDFEQTGSEHPKTHHAAASAAVPPASQAAGGEYPNAGYPASYEQQNDYYTNQHAAYQQPYSPDSQQQQQYYSNGYYGTAGTHDAMAMQNLESANNSYVPPPPHPGTTSSPTVAAAVAMQSSPRPSDTFPQSLRSKPKGWGDESSPRESSMDMAPNNSSAFHNNEKAEFEEGEELEPPRSRTRFMNDRDDFTSRRSMTPPRANMQSYREEFSRPSGDRGGSDRGSVTGLDIVRGEQQGDDLTRGSLDSPESARRRARAAELFSAEGTRR